MILEIFIENQKKNLQHFALLQVLSFDLFLKLFIFLEN